MFQSPLRVVAKDVQDTGNPRTHVQNLAALYTYELDTSCKAHSTGFASKRPSEEIGFGITQPTKTVSQEVGAISWPSAALKAWRLTGVTYRNRRRRLKIGWKPPMMRLWGSRPDIPHNRIGEALESFERSNALIVARVGTGITSSLTCELIHIHCY